MKLFIASAIVAIATFTSYNVYYSQSKKQLSDIALANLEALASGETLPEVEVSCGSNGGKCWASGYDYAYCERWEFYYAICVFTGSMDDSCSDMCD